MTPSPNPATPEGRKALRAKLAETTEIRFITRGGDFGPEEWWPIDKAELLAALDEIERLEAGIPGALRQIIEALPLMQPLAEDLPEAAVVKLRATVTHFVYVVQQHIADLEAENTKLRDALDFILTKRTLCNSDKCCDSDHAMASCPYGRARAALRREP